jgi:hypothetical protein
LIKYLKMGRSSNCVGIWNNHLAIRVSQQRYRAYGGKDRFSATVPVSEHA